MDLQVCILRLRGSEITCEPTADSRDMMGCLREEGGEAHIYI